MNGKERERGEAKDAESGEPRRQGGVNQGGKGGKEESTRAILRTEKRTQR